MSHTILVIDDDDLNRKILEKELTEKGYKVQMAIDGQDGLIKVRSLNPDMVLLDVMMPKMDGYNVCRMLKFDEKHKNIPIIMLTAKHQEQDRSTGAEVGADAYCAKSSDLSELFSVIDRLLK